MAIARREIEKKLSEFFNTPNLTEEAAYAKSGEFFSDIAQYLNLGHIDIEFYVPDNAFSVENIHKSRVIYDNGKDYDLDKFIEITFPSAKNGHVDVYVYPTTDREFTKLESNAIKFIINVFYNLACSLKYKSLLQDVNFKDPLTQGPNLAALIEFMYRLKAQGELDNYVVMFCNIKSFKNINQVYGYDTCNGILKTYLELVREHLGSNGMIGRLGGDNSLCVVRKDYFNHFADLIKKESIEFNNIVIDIESWLGCYEITDIDDPHDAIQYSQLANQYCKQVTRESMYIFTQKDKESIKEEHQIRGGVIDALKYGGFETYYQPKVDINSYHLIGCEALVRWFNNGVMVPNYKFIPIIEKSNLVCDLDFYMLDKVCKDIRDWCNQGIIPVRTSVNFSRNHVSHSNTLDRILKTIDQYNIDPAFIEVELTELTYYRDFDAFAKFIENLRSHGIPVSMDDFGSGYSSITLLEKANYNIVKLDKSIVDNVGNHTNLKELIIIRKMIEMLKELDVEIVAEGVEKEEQITFLRNLGCNTIQGYYFDKPLPHDEFQKRLINKQY